jgi:hypothetical protein
MTAKGTYGEDFITSSKRCRSTIGCTREVEPGGFGHIALDYCAGPWEADGFSPQSRGEARAERRSEGLRGAPHRKRPRGQLRRPTRRDVAWGPLSWCAQGAPNGAGLSERSREGSGAT